MEGEKITVATANAQRGHLIRTPGGLDPFNGTDILLLSEVKPKRDKLENRLNNAGFQLAYADQTDLAIAVKNGYKVLSAQEYPLTSNGFIKHALAKTRFGRLFGIRNMIVAKVQTPTGEIVDVATAHPVPYFRPFARINQVNEMNHILKSVIGSDQFIIGADFNHHPGPQEVDQRMRKENGLSAVNLGGKDTFIYRRRGQLDDMLYRGQGISEINTKVIDVQSDHRAIISRFSLARMQQSPPR